MAATACSNHMSVPLVRSRADLLQVGCGQALDLGSATLGKIKQNLGWALVYNLFGIPLAAGALLPAFDLSLNPAAAGGMMAFSSIAVVTNSLLLRGHGSKQPALSGGIGTTGSSGATSPSSEQKDALNTAGL